MRMSIEKLRAQGVEVDWDKDKKHLWFNTDGRIADENLDALDRVYVSLGFNSTDCDSANCELFKISMMRAISNSMG